MKRIILLFALLLIIFSANKAKCGVSPFPCVAALDCKEIHYVTDTICFPESPDCPIAFYYQYRLCSEDGIHWKYLITINGYGAQFSYPECDSIAAKYFGDNPTDDMFERLWLEIPKIIFLQDMENSQNPTSYYCDYGETTFEVYFTSCRRLATMPGAIPYKRRADTNKIMSEGGGDAGNRWYKWVDCADNICCMRGQKLCWDQEKQEIVVRRYSSTYLIGECGTDPRPVEGAISVTECKSPCKEE